MEQVYVPYPWLLKYEQLNAQWQNIAKLLPSRSKIPKPTHTLPLVKEAIGVQD
jgi:hypothetical protein